VVNPGVEQNTDIFAAGLACRAGDNRTQIPCGSIKSTYSVRMVQCVPLRTALEPVVVVVLVKVEPGPSRLDRELKIRPVLVAERPPNNGNQLAKNGSPEWAVARRDEPASEGVAVSVEEELALYPPNLSGSR